MSVFDLDEDGEQAAGRQAADSGVSIDDVQPGFFDRAAYGAGMGVARGAVKVGRAVALATSVPLTAYEKAKGYEPGEITDSYFDMVVKPLDEDVEFYTPNANEVGTAGRVLGGLAEIVAPLAAGGGNPALLTGTVGLNTPVDLVRQGVDSGTAVAAGVLDATVARVGFELPFLGKTLRTRAASGALGNLALGTASTAAERVLLDARGYDELAKQYNPLDIEARTVDLLTGAAFGGLAHLGRPAEVSPSERDAALAGLNAKHYQSDTAPGRPADESALAAHQRAIEQALRQLQEDRPVEVGESGVTEADFVERPPPEPLTENLQPTLDELGIGEPAAPREPFDIPRAEVLNVADRQIESRFIAKLRRDPDAAMREYAALPDSAGGKLLNTDTARELSPDYLSDRTKSAAVHEPASAIIKEIYKRKLAEEPGPGEEPLVVFSAGGTGAGKSSGLELTGADRTAQIVYDSNMNSLESSVRRIEQALAAGKRVDILYTYRDPVVALTSGALPRAMRQESTYGTGRTVPLVEHAKTHIGSAQVVREIAAKYKDNPQVQVRVIDNSLGLGKAAVSTLEVVPKGSQDQNALVRRLNEALDEEFAAGRISESVYRGFKGDQAGTVRPGQARGPAGAGDRGSAEPNQPDGSSRPAADEVGHATDTGTAGRVGAAVPDAQARGIPGSGQLRGGGDGRSSGEADGSTVRPRPLDGLPATVKVKGRGEVTPAPYAPAHEAARKYAEQAGIDYRPPTKYAKVVVERAKRIADTFENTPHAPADPQVKAAYEAMIRETLAQYQFIKQSGLKVEPIEPGMADPYAQSPWHAILDVRENNHLWFFPTESGFGSDGAFTADTHPLLAPTGEYIGGRQLLANDVFRIVHDYFGHVKDGVGFRADGEENAWRSHSAMYSPLARRAMTAETRGQNSWVNYGPYGEANRGASGGETKYANQKALLLPEEFSVVDDAGVVAKPAAAPADAAATPAKPTDASEAQADPDVLAARQLVEQSDLEIPTGELDADGQPIVTSARELLAAADAEVARAESDGKGYEAAISCLLSFGGGT